MDIQGSSRPGLPPRAVVDERDNAGRTGCYQADFGRAGEPTPGPLYRIWIAEVRDWQPVHWYDVPPAAIAWQPAEAGCFAADHACGYLESFNRQMLADSRPLWAVALPVRIEVAGDVQAGERIAGYRFAPEANCDLPQ
jgi:hypothetical protein